MLPLERQKRIKELIYQKKSIKISALSELLNVSEMTIHRDLKPLIETGEIMKTFGGVTLANELDPPTAPANHECVFCRKSINERLTYRLILQNNEIETACCAHCGLLRHRQIKEKVIQAICTDFLTQTTISSVAAWYVMDTSVHIGCCKPQVLTFESKNHAERFVKGFGGELHSFQEAMENVFLQMHGDPCSCHQKGHP
ncbi:DeoR family transcriptional regulator [Virgibacillus halophilus]|uniref:DeoR family transcriptional regulator n=1 Tax=Tigheibacillus halophilus TaxID=361280 RepID=A0ABU5C1M6_9BACI|nr:DeoR family transcriptional regulator [Virgibacillus halophilus]